MFDKFTHRARKVMGSSRQEAGRLGHDHIGTEHILLGLASVVEGLGAKVLLDLGSDSERVRLAVEDHVTRGDADSKGKLPFSANARQVLEAAMAASQGMRHNYVGTEHLLLGLVRTSECTACGIISTLGLPPERVEARVLALLPPDAFSRTPEPPKRFAKDLAKVVEEFPQNLLLQAAAQASRATEAAIVMAMQEMESTDCNELKLEHLKLGIARYVEMTGGGDYSGDTPSPVSQDGPRPFLKEGYSRDSDRNR